MAFVLDPCLQEPFADGWVDSFPGGLLLLAPCVPIGDTGGLPIGIDAPILVLVEVPGRAEGICDELPLFGFGRLFLCGRGGGFGFGNL